jgi:7-keto-8-aminopelargonate synthetase-like enzyme
MRDRSHPLELLRQAASGRAAAGVRRALVPRGPNLDGRARDGLLDLASNDYLGLCGDERLNAAAAEAARVWGTGSTGSRLEAALAEFTGAAGALVFSSGYLANLTWPRWPNCTRLLVRAVPSSVLDEAHAFGVTGPGGGAAGRDRGRDPGRPRGGRGRGVPPGQCA